MNPGLELSLTAKTSNIAKKHQNVLLKRNAAPKCGFAAATSAPRARWEFTSARSAGPRAAAGGAGLLFDRFLVSLAVMSQKTAVSQAWGVYLHRGMVLSDGAARPFLSQFCWGVN